MKKPMKLKCDFGIGDSIGHLIIWLLLTIVTLGLALLVFPYYFVKAIINKTSVLADDGISVVGKLKCDIDLSAAIGNAFVWLILIHSYVRSCLHNLCLPRNADCYFRDHNQI